MTKTQPNRHELNARRKAARAYDEAHQALTDADNAFHMIGLNKFGLFQCLGKMAKQTDYDESKGGIIFYEDHWGNLLVDDAMKTLETAATAFYLACADFAKGIYAKSAAKANVEACRRIVKSTPKAIAKAREALAAISDEPTLGVRIFTVKAQATFDFSLKIRAKTTEEARELARIAVFENGYCPMSPRIENDFDMDEVVDWSIDPHGDNEIGDVE